MSHFTLTKGKVYGLIMPGAKKAAAKTVARPSVFGDSSSDEEDDGKKHVNLSLKREQQKQKKQTQEAADKALAEDPSIFEYDSLYDKMTEKKKKTKLNRDTKPKYIHTLKRAAERRKLEGELVYEHRAQREIEKDEEQFRDKESFVTPAYKKKLAERRILEEELAREAAVEEANDVTKQKDLSRFHKHLFNQVTSPSESTENERKQPSSGTGEKTGGSFHSEKEREKDNVRGYESRGRGEGRERRHSSEREGGGRGERERQRRDSDRERGGKDKEERGRRDSGDTRGSRGHYHERRSSHRERRDSHRRDGTPDEHQPSNTTSDDKQASNSPTDVRQDESSQLPPKKKTKIQAGIEVEAEEMDPLERRKLAATKKATEESTKSAKERYLARRRARADARKLSSTSDD